MIAAVERALTNGRHLLVSAPSGIGKTAGALYPVLKYALAHDKRVFFVTAKNTQLSIVRETLRRMSRTGVPPVHAEMDVEDRRDAYPTTDGFQADRQDACPTLVQFRAREKMCINSVYACREEFCPFLQDMAVKTERTGLLDRLLAERLITPEMMMDARHGCACVPV